MRLIVGLLAALWNGAPLAAEDSWAKYRFAPDALEEVDLSSDTEWTLSIDGGAPRPIKVTAGGWNSDQQEPQIPSNAVKDHAVYERKITIPATAKGNVVKILFGGCNYGAEVWLDDKQITHHYAPMTPFTANLTGVAHAGRTHVLRVKAYSRMHFGSPPTVPVGFDFNKDIPGVRESFNGCTRFAYGLTGHVRLAIYPPVYIADVFVRPSVANKTLAYDVWVANETKQPCTVELKGVLAPWDTRSWTYPTLPQRTLRIGAGTTEQVTVNSIRWNVGPESYWWPNIPFREDYTATLHWLKLSLEEGGKPAHQRQQRFGFVEYREGPYYYTVNGVRFASFGDNISYGQVGEYDCWTETPCFQPPHGRFKGCSDTWKRYQRIGFNSMRLSTSVPTGYMLETADEAGYMLIPEGGSWGNGTSAFHTENFSRQLQATIRAVRNHPCVARYSLANESPPAELEGPGSVARNLIDAALEVDNTRPYVFEVKKDGGSGLVPGVKRGHAYRMQHYDPIVKGGDHIRGMGESVWATDGMGNYAMQAVKMRMNDYAHFAPWSWMNYWPNFLEGMNSKRHPWTYNNYGDRQDGVDGWGSLMVKTVQRSIHPYLIVDNDLLEMNPVIREGSKDGKVGWPYRLPVYAPEDSIERHIEVFNGGLFGTSFSLRWTARWDGPDGPIGVAAQTNGLFVIRPGFHATRTIRFTVPAPDRDRRQLWLIIESLKDDNVVYTEDRINFTVSRIEETATATFAGTDDQTQGDWKGKYGQVGYALAGKEAQMPGNASFAWSSGTDWIWRASTDDKRALMDSANAPAGKARFAACRSGDAVSFSLDLGETLRRLSLYVIDWYDAGRQMEVLISGTDSGKLLDRHKVASFTHGRWLTWMARGRVTVDLTPTAGNIAVVSGVFIDPAK